MRSPLLIPLAIAFLLPGLAAAELRDFEDSFGRIMKAELVSHSGADAEMVKMKRADGKQYDINVSKFSEKDQAVIRAWMKDTPPTINYAFRIEAKKGKLGSGGSTSYSVEVSNLARETVDGIVVKTRSIYEYSYVPYSGNYYGYGGRFVGHEEKFEIPGEMKFNQTAKFPTSRHYNLIGLMVRVYGPSGKVVAEEKIGSTKMSSLKWDDGRKRRSSSSSRIGSADADDGGKSTVTIED